MIRDDKVKMVEELRERFAASPHAVLAAYRGLTANSANELRRKVDSVGGRYIVIKNRLARRAAESTPLERLAAQFMGPCAVATHDSDPILLAKTMSEFVKDNPQVELLGAIVDGADLVDGEGVKTLAKLPGLPELRAQLLSVINAPATTLVRLIATPGTQVARVIDARREALGGASEG